MFKRDVRLYLDDIDEAIAAIEDYTINIDFNAFCNDRKTYSATLREFIVIGEAIANIPDPIKEKAPSIEWRLIKDFRNFLSTNTLASMPGLFGTPSSKNFTS